MVNKGGVNVDFIPLCISARTVFKSGCLATQVYRIGTQYVPDHEGGSDLERDANERGMNPRAVSESS
jgi:hypothetical protein